MTPIVTSAEVVNKEEQMIGGFASYTVTFLISNVTDNGTIEFRTTNSNYAASLLVGQTYTITIS